MSRGTYGIVLVLAALAVPGIASAQGAGAGAEVEGDGRGVDVDVDSSARARGEAGREVEGDVAGSVRAGGEAQGDADGRLDDETNDIDGRVDEDIHIDPNSDGVTPRAQGGGEFNSPPFGDDGREIEGDRGADQDDAYPEPAMPRSGEGEDGLEVVDQAGVGSTTAYGRAGVVELGGSIGLSWTERLFQFNVSPSIGVFVADNFELTGILDVRYVNTSDGGAQRTDSTVLMFLAEPSYHLPLSETFFLFGGLGLGVGYDGTDAGFAMAPRVGTNILVGRSGILTPAAQLTWTTSGIDDADGAPILGLNVGYTVMW